MSSAIVHSSPSIDTITTSSPHSPQIWRFPGPSSRYNERERSKYQPRADSNVTIPIATTFHTERRAHRRAQSSSIIPTIKAKDRASLASQYYKTHSRYNSVFTTPDSISESRSPLSRHSSFTRRQPTMPSTPSKSSSQQTSPLPQHSPHSDYYTDDNHSLEELASQESPGKEAQQLLNRLGKLQGTLVRGGNDSQALRIIGRRMSEIESEMDSFHSQSRPPAEMDDSGLFMDEEVERKDSIHSKPVYSLSKSTLNDLAARDEHEEKAKQYFFTEVESTLEALHNAKTEMAGKVVEWTSILQKNQEELKKTQTEIENLIKLSKNKQNVAERVIASRDSQIQRLNTTIRMLNADLNGERIELGALKGQFAWLESRYPYLKGPENANIKKMLGALKIDWQDITQRFEDSKRLREARAAGRTDVLPDRPHIWVPEVELSDAGQVLSVTARRLDGRKEVNEEEKRKQIENEIQRLESSRPKYAERGTQTEKELVAEVAQDVIAGAEDSETHVGYEVDEEKQQNHESNAKDANEEFEVVFDESMSTHLPKPDIMGKFKTHELVDECAITSSSSTENGDDEEEEEDEANESDDSASEADTFDDLKTVLKSAYHQSSWEELCRDLADLAGVGSSRW